MSEIIEALQGGGMTFVQAALVWKVFGPWATHIGKKLPEMGDRAADNFWRMIYAARDRLGGRLDQPGEIPPRVLRGAINEAPYCDDKIAADYLGGVLASSRREEQEGDDDRGVVMNALLARLSSYQIRSHYLIYHAVHDLFQGVPARVCNHMGVTIPAITFLASLRGVSDTTSEDLEALFGHVFGGLERESLISMYEVFHDESDDLTFTPSQFGIELFLWAYGYGRLPTSDFLSNKLEFPISNEVFLPRNTVVIKDSDNSDGVEVKSYWYYPEYQPIVCPIEFCK